MDVRVSEWGLGGRMETTKPTKFHEKDKEWELGRWLCRSRFFRAVFVSFVVSWMEEITAEAQRPRRDAKEDGVSEKGLNGNDEFRMSSGGGENFWIKNLLRLRCLS